MIEDVADLLKGLVAIVVILVSTAVVVVVIEREFPGRFSSGSPRVYREFWLDDGTRCIKSSRGRISCDWARK